MSNDPGRTTGETHGTEQEPVEAGERDATQREQAANEGAPAEHDPSSPTQTTQDAYGQSPDAAYGQREGQAEDPTNLGQEEIGEEGGDSEPVVTGG
jgi:hypothetical protein